MKNDMDKITKIVMYIDIMAHGGAQRVMANLSDLFVKDNVQVILVNDFRLEDDVFQYQLNDKVRRLYLKETNEGNTIIKNVERIIKLRKIVRKEKPHIVLSFLGRPNMRMLIATIGLKTKKVVSVRNDPYQEYGKNFLYRNFAKMLFLLSDGCVFQTNDAKSYFPKLVQRKSVVIVNPVGEEFYSASRSGYTTNVISVGRLELQKNNELLIRAYKKIEKKYPKDKLIFYGTGSRKEYLEKLVEELELRNRVFFEGDTNNVLEKLKCCKIFVLSSDYEGLPNALMEAMAVGVPCISTDCPCGGPRELIVSDKVGILVPVGDIEKMSSALEGLLKYNEKRELLAINSKKRAQEFRASKVFLQWKEYFNKIFME